MSISAELDIVNSALVLLDEALLEDLDSNNSKTARYCNLKWPTTRDVLLRLHPWNCTRKRAILVVDETPPLFGFEYSYTLPSDPYCLRPLAIQYSNDGDYIPIDNTAFGGTRSKKYQFVIEGRNLLTNTAGTVENTLEQEGINLIYTQRPANDAVNLYDASLLELFMYKLASELAYPISGSRNLGLTFAEQYKQLLKEARALNSQEICPGIPVSAVLGAYN
jgi:hypothetical protein